MEIEQLKSESIEYLRLHGYDADGLVEEISVADLPSLTGWFSIQKVRQTAENIVDEGWKFSRFDPVFVHDLHDWSQYGRHHRSWGFHLHAWEFMDPLLAAADDDPSSAWLDRCVQIALNWIQTEGHNNEDVDPLVWYDMSLSLRMPRLIAVTLRAARQSELRDQTVVLLSETLRHLHELRLDRAFNAKNNHGFYTAVSQVHAAKYLRAFGDERERTAHQGQNRLEVMVESQFSEDGIQLEHSPDYHRMLLSSFQRAVEDGLIENGETRARIERAAHALGWMIQPDGTIVQFGDSPATKMVGVGLKSVDPGTQFVLSDGEMGTPLAEELAVYDKGGYAFVRSPQPAGHGDLSNTGYLAFSAAFHSRAHKHADDLNLVWFDRGMQILSDSGRYGYGDLLDMKSPMRNHGFYYSSPERQYVEGSMAHNVLQVDGVDHQRKGRKPYGSALTDCAQVDDRFDLSGRVRHRDYVHRRRVVYVPRRRVTLIDSVHTRLSDTRVGRIWLNLDAAFELEDVGDEVVFRSTDSNDPFLLRIKGPGEIVSPVKGQQVPLRGWRSRTDGALEPTWSLGFSFEFQTRRTVTTTLNLE